MKAGEKAQENLPGADKGDEREVSMEITGIAQEGLRRAEAKLERAAERVSRPEAPDSVDLSEAAVELIQARNLYEANLKLVKTAEQMQKHILDVLG